jgi:hypothetical protein
MHRYTHSDGDVRTQASVSCIVAIPNRTKRLWPHQSQEKSNQTYANDGIANPSDERLDPLLSPPIHAGKLHAPRFCKENLTSSGVR